MWQVMKEITGKQKTKSNLLPREIKVDKTIIQKPQEIAKEFTKFFTSVGPKLARKIFDTENSFQDFLASHNEKMLFEELNFDEFEEAFKSLKRNKAAGFDDLSSNIIIDACDSLRNILLHVSKVSIKQGIFPDNLRIAKVSPIFKSGAKDNVSNYRPISILPVFSKVLERIMYNRVYNNLDSKGLLYEKRLGFQRNNSTEHAILQLTQDITSSFEKWEYTLGAFIDLSKAFDPVDHQILIKKLLYYGIEGTALKWFKSYLSNRKQFISSQDISGRCLDITCGVPQGSILGPLPFLIYVNDLFKASNPLMEVMFADDTNLFLSHKNIDTLFAIINVELENVSTWFKSNKLSLNVNKTKWSLFHPLSKRQFLPQTMPNLVIGDAHIKREHVTIFFYPGNNTSKY